MIENIDVLAPGDESSWTFYIAGKAKKISEVLDEILDITKKVFVINEGFFIPKKINYAILTFSEDYSANEVFEHKSLYGNEGNIKSENKVLYDDLMKDVQSHKIRDDLVNVIRRISIKGKTKFVLRDREDYIDSNSPLDIYSNFDYEGNRSDDPFRRDPVWLQIHHNYLRGENIYVGNCETAFYEITFWSETGMWFEKTDVGLANRNNLRSVIKKLYDNFDVTGTLFMSDWYSKEELIAVAFGKD